MSHQETSVEENIDSMDTHSDAQGNDEPNVSHEWSHGSVGGSDSEPTDDVPEWKGMSMDEIYKGSGLFEHQQHPKIRATQRHAVLFQLPINESKRPGVFPAQTTDKWNACYVRMPHSAHSLYPVELANGTRQLRVRWEVIQEKLLQTFVSSAQLEAAILSYNNKYAQHWNFCALHHFFEHVVEEKDGEYFFAKLLPKIIDLALQLPALVTGAIPLMKRHENRCISLSQLQVASLLANAFLCTFPRRNSTNPQSEYATYPYINFNRLFSAYREDKPNRSNAVVEKLKCIFHYFRRVTSKAPEGTITIERRHIPQQDCPDWNKLKTKLCPLHITSKGTIESEGAGLLQVDFANKFVGGGVLNWGCVQEEIRFVICPELMVTMLVTEALDDTEALVVSGIERYSDYEGYSNNFTWTGDFVDETPRDDSGRRKTSLVAIDALSFKQPNAQFNRENILRELNKAYVGFSSTEMNENKMPAIATGNWGCGAFRGNPKLKVLLQLMAAAAARRSMVYFTFGDTDLRDNVADMYWHLVQRNIDVGQLLSLLSQYENVSSRTRLDFYRFLYNRSRMKPLTEYFRSSRKNSESDFSIGDSAERGVQTEEKKRRTNKLLRPTKRLSGLTEPETPIETLGKSEESEKRGPARAIRETGNYENSSSEEEPWRHETKAKIIHNDNDGQSHGSVSNIQTNTSLWDAINDREAKKISGRRILGLEQIEESKMRSKRPDVKSPNANTIIVVEDCNNEIVEEKPMSSFRSSVTQSNSPGKRGITPDKNQPTIFDYFARKIS